MSKSNYINRELSWLKFNGRVLAEAQDSSNPLLERLKFLAISGSNLDEFFMVRVGSLTVVAKSATQQTGIAGLTADEQLKRIRKDVLRFNEDQHSCFCTLEKQLSKEGIVRVKVDDLNDEQRDSLKQFFDDEVLSVVAPVAIDRTEEFPMLSGARLCLCARLKNTPDEQLVEGEQADEDRFAIVPLGKSMRRIVPVACDSRFGYMLLEDVVGMFVDDLFGKQSVAEWTVFRVTRNADITLDEDAAADLLSGMEQMLEDREQLGCVRLELSNLASDSMVAFLKSATNSTDDKVYAIKGPIDYSEFFSLSSISGFNGLKNTPWPPQPSPDFPPEQDPFEVIAEGDRILYHPYQSYEPVVDFIRAAAEDPDVIAIKQTLYRTSRDSQIVQALITAAENGKHVTVIVELKARFDEARNIQWAKRMELAGVDVIYGVKGLKTHAKICIVVRREPTGIRRYLHVATGNYNESTSNLYSDVSMFTCDEQLGLDGVHIFNAITGLSVPQQLHKIAAAPINLRETLIDLIRIETENAKAGNAAAITAKINSLVDKEIIDTLYEASQAGVKIRLNVRGICCLRPGVKGLSKNIKVVSVLGRFLEHARIFCFRHDGDNRVLISSADWMGRNLNRRVELLVPVENRQCKTRVTNILESYFKDNVKAQVMRSDGSYEPKKRSKGETRFQAQEHLYEESCEIFAAHANPRTTVFKPHRGESA